MSPVAPLSPRVLGRYALHDVIASGGMATVHLGRLLGHVGFERTVAIKRLHPQFAQDPEFVSMFLDEARAVARIRHPNVVPTLDVVAADGELFLVMEYVQGESLSRLIRTTAAEGRLIPPAFVATVLIGVLHGLHAAHEAKSEQGAPLSLVHRDVSPQNIQVGTDGVARLLDFGVAKAAGRTQTTREGQLKGKPGYMAPEQLSGIVSRTTDVYSAAVVLWESLTGRRLFSGESDVHVMKRVLQGCDVPPSTYVPGLPAAFDAVTMRGLDRDPDKRFATAREMAVALEEAIQPAAASRVGEWVEALAKETLAERNRQIASIEASPSQPSADVSPHPKSTQNPAPVVTVLAPPVPPVPSRAPADDVTRTQLSSASAFSPGPPGGTSRWRAFAGGAALALLAIGLGTLGLASFPTKAFVPASSPSSSPFLLPQSSPAIAAAPSASDSTSAGRLAPSMLAGIDASATATQPLAVAPLRPAPVHRSAPARSSNCNPPYFFDHDGNRIFKKECVR